MPSPTLSTLRYAITWLTDRAELIEEDCALNRGGVPVPATLIHPRLTKRPLPAWVVLHGITRPGRAHAQLVRFTRALASTGVAAIVPEVPEWSELQLAPRLTAPTVYAAIEALSELPGVAADRVGLVGFSFGAPHAIAAAGDPCVRARVAGAVGFGGYCDLERTIRFMLTGRHEWAGEGFQLRPDPYGRWIVAANYLTAVPEHANATDVADALRRLAAVAGDDGLMAWDPYYDPIKVRLRAQIEPERRGLFDLFAPPSDQEPEGEEVARLAEALAEAGRRVDPEIEPARLLAQVECPVVVLHGRRDHLIPFSEGLRIHEALRNATERSATITRLFGHAAQDPWPSPLQATREVPRLMRALSRMFELV
jgi:dienelactone hydrolase